MSMINLNARARGLVGVRADEADPAAEGPKGDAGVEGRAKWDRNTDFAVHFNPDLFPIAPEAIPSPGRTVSTKARFYGPAFAHSEPARTFLKVRPFPTSEPSCLENALKNSFAAI